MKPIKVSRLESEPIDQYPSEKMSQAIIRRPWMTLLPIFTLSVRGHGLLLRGTAAVGVADFLLLFFLGFFCCCFLVVFVVAGFLLLPLELVLLLCCEPCCSLHQLYIYLSTRICCAGIRMVRRVGTGAIYPVRTWTLLRE